MVNKLRWKLTTFNTAITGAILVCMLILCVFLFEKNNREQTYRNFTDTFHNVSSYLETQNQIPETWLREMEGGGRCRISIRDANVPLFSQSMSKEKDLWEPEFRKARAYAKDNFGIEYGPEKRKGDCYCFFSQKSAEDVNYYAGVSLISKGDAVLELILLYSLEEMEEGIYQLRIIVLAAAIAAGFLLALFSWFFTGKMLRPIQENQQRQTEFIAAASHELRTPLAAILSAASAMERAEPVQRAQFSDMIHREGNRMSRLIGDMLTLASSDSKAWVLKKTPVELDMLLLEVYEAHYSLAKEQGITLTLSLYEQDIPPMKLDRDRIAQVVSILLDNARNHAADPGKIELELAVHRNRVQIRVADNGLGVPDYEKKRIFDRFYRSERARSNRGHYGLGLSIASQIIKKHNGRIWVQDATIGGAEFIVELPVI